MRTAMRNRSLAQSLRATCLSAARSSLGGSAELHATLGRAPKVRAVVSERAAMARQANG